MRSLKNQIVWRPVIASAFFFVIAGSVGFYLVEKKAESQIADTIEYIRDSKFASLNQDNLKSAFNFSSLNYTTYIIDEKGALLIPGNFKVDQQIIDFCRANSLIGKKFSIDGQKKYVAVRKNANLCLVVESNTNAAQILGSFSNNILLGLLALTSLFLFVFLKLSYSKVYKLVKSVSDNAEEALVSNWDNIMKQETNIVELQNLAKYTSYVFDLLRQKSGNEGSSKLGEIKDYQLKYGAKTEVNNSNKFKLAVDSAKDVVVIVDKFGYINYVNKSLTGLTGLTLSDVENKKITDLWHKEDDANLWKENYEKVLTTKQAVSFICSGLKKQDLKYESEVQISPIKNENDSVENFLVVERDVSEEKQKERTKNEFISVVSHELRTPMTIIRGYSALLSDGKLGEINAKQKQYIDKISFETGRLLELANDMLDLQKFASGKIELRFEKCNIPSTISKIVEDFKMDFEKKNLTLTFENSLKNEYANIDSKYFERIVTNLLTNAYKYTDKGGVKVFLVNPDPKNIVIAVKDTGMGIKETALPHLFERFYQAENVMQRKQEGSGLGLSIVKKVIEAHNGMVWVESKEGVGSTFYVAIATSE